jgi:hypothetical protein
MKKIMLATAVFVLSSQAIASDVAIKTAAGISSIDIKYLKVISFIDETKSYCVQDNKGDWYDHSCVGNPRCACLSHQVNLPNWPAPIPGDSDVWDPTNTLPHFGIPKINGQAAPTNCVDLSKKIDYQANKSHVITVTLKGCQVS